MDSDSEIDSEPSSRQATRRLPERAAKAKLRAPTRMTRSTAAYFSSQSPTTDNDSDASTDDDRINGRKRRNTTSSARTSKRTRRSLRSQTHQKPQRSQRRPKRSKPRHPRPKTYILIDKEEIVLAGDWANLPYLVWTEVFEHVAAPLRDPKARLPDISSASRSLLSAARTSKSLAQPALTALYKSPILSPSSAHFLVQRLALPQSGKMFNYRPMIETLRIEVDETLARKFMSQYLNLKDLIQNLPRLMDIELYHRLDQPPYRNLDDTIRWKYPPELFEALEPLPETGVESTDKTTYTALRSWSWSSRLAGEICSLDRLSKIHQLPSFASLRHITFVNYQLPSITSKSRDPAEILAMDMPKIEQLATAINTLPRLDHLTLESSTWLMATC